MGLGRFAGSGSLECMSACLCSALLLTARQPAAFNITLNRTYRWDTENSKEQVHFVNTLIRTFRDLTRGAPLNVVGNIVEEPRRTSSQPSFFLHAMPNSLTSSPCCFPSKSSSKWIHNSWQRYRPLKNILAGEFNGNRHA